jgi:hypothetical protein
LHVAAIAADTLPLTPVALPGWQYHPVSNSRYHFIVPSEATVEDTRQLAAVVEGKFLGRLPLSHRWSPPAPDDGAEDDYGPYNAAASVFESQDHLLHGVLHANGFGHLLRMNGSQGGSRKLIGACGLQDEPSIWQHSSCQDRQCPYDSFFCVQCICCSFATMWHSSGYSAACIWHVFHLHAAPAAVLHLLLCGALQASSC